MHKTNENRKIKRKTENQFSVFLFDNSKRKTAKKVVGIFAGGRKITGRVIGGGGVYIGGGVESGRVKKWTRRGSEKKRVHTWTIDTSCSLPVLPLDCLLNYIICHYMSGWVLAVWF